jgi:hypothetical protein
VWPWPERTRQPDAERTGAFYAKDRHVSHANGPSLEVCVTGGSCPKPKLTQVGAEAIDGNGDVLIPVSIDSHHYPGGIEI